MILLTGSNGFIGRNIKEQWGEPLLCPTRAELDLRDFSDVREYLHKHKPEKIIHCGSNDNDICLYDNLKMFHNLADSEIPMITFCTGREVEDRAYKNGEYVLSKKIISEDAFMYYDNISVIQLWGCFGKYEKDIRFFMSNMLRIKNEEYVLVEEDKMFSYVYVNDVVEIIKETEGKQWIRPVAYTMFLSEYGDILNSVIKGKNKISAVFTNREGFCNSYVGKNNIDFKYTPLKVALKEMWENVNISNSA